MASRKPPPESVPADADYQQHMSKVARSRRLDTLSDRLTDELDALKDQLQHLEDVLEAASDIAVAADFPFSCAKINRAYGALGAILAAVENFSQHTDW